MSNLLHLNDENFDSEVKASALIVVDFWANWCGPCRALGPTIEALADEYAGKVKIAKCNVDDSPAASAKWRIQSIPAIIAFRNGVEVGRVIGNAPAKVRDLVAGLL
ncbi:MAG: thioredoxin [Proteobacteria bacterium]|nr:thioredoxin [Pseudomonadota bacterium]